MASALPSNGVLNQKLSPWNVEIVTPSPYLIKIFEDFDKTKSTAPKLRSFNRAKKWISKGTKK